LLQYAHKLDFKEFLNALSMLRLGAVMGYINHDSESLDDYIAYLAQFYTNAGPYYLQEVHGLSETAALNARVSMARDILLHSELDTSF
jgi:protein-arginine kinase